MRDSEWRPRLWRAPTSGARDAIGARTHTGAFGINAPKAPGDFRMLDAIRATGGTAVAVTGEELLAEVGTLARHEGTFICPEEAACMAAARQLRESGWLNADEEVVVLNAGTGLKYPQVVNVDVPTLDRDEDPPGIV